MAHEWWRRAEGAGGNQAEVKFAPREPEKMMDLANRQDTSVILPPVTSAITSVASVPGINTGLVIETGQPTTSSVPTTATPTSTPPQTTAATESPAAQGGDGSQEGSSDGLSTAAKAGIAIGALGGALALFVLLWCVIGARRKRRSRQLRPMEDDEKLHGPIHNNNIPHTSGGAGDSVPMRSPAIAPRLSLRPVTQFLPNFGSGSNDRRTSRGIALTLNPVTSAPSPTNSTSPLNRPHNGSAWERPTISSTMTSPMPDRDRAGTQTSMYSNPFHDGKKLPEEPVSPVSSIGSLDRRLNVRGSSADAMPEPVSPIGGDDEGAGAALAERRTSLHRDLPKPLDLTMRGMGMPGSPSSGGMGLSMGMGMGMGGAAGAGGMLGMMAPPSPTGTEYSMHSMAPGQVPAPTAGAAAIAAAGGPPQSTVHRVQLDFKPSLDDEMELRAGQLVRLLHEYDDGWALCIRLDRSQQGVVPRTCLSTRPVKPRPPQGSASSSRAGGPPVNPSYHTGQPLGSNNPYARHQDRPRSPGGGGGGYYPPPGQAY